MKKTISISLVLAMLLSLAVPAASAAPDETIIQTQAEFQEYVRVSSAEGRVGEEVKLTVSLVNNPGLSAYFITIKYDEAKLTYVKTEPGSLLTNNFHVHNRGNGNLGMSAYTAMATDVFDDPLELYTITFRIKRGHPPDRSKV